MNLKNKSWVHVLAGFGILSCLLLIYLLPLLLSLDKYFTLYPKNIPNWYGNLTVVAVTADPVIKSHQLPLWVPEIDGGRPFHEYPMYKPFGPSHLLSALFNENISLKIYWCFFVLAGACSMFYLAFCVLDLTMLGSLYSALVFSMSGVFAYLFENGSLFCRELLLLPLLMAFFIKGQADRRFIVLASFILSLIIINSALFVPITVLFIFTYCILGLSLKGRSEFLSSLKLIKSFVFLCCLAVALSAFRLVPLMAHLDLNNRISGLNYSGAITQANTIGLFFRRIFSPESYGAGTMYLGFLPVVAAIFGAVLYYRQFKNYVLLLLLFVVLSFGPNSPIDLHRILWNLPVFKSIIEIAKYYAVFIVFTIAILSGASFSLLRERKRAAFVAVILLLLTGMTYLDLLKNSRYFNVFNEKLEFKTNRENLYHVRGLNLPQGDESIAPELAYFLYKKNVGVLWPRTFWSRGTGVVPRYFLLPRYALIMPYTGLLVLPNPEYKGEAYFLHPSNSVQKTVFSPNRIDLFITMARSGDQLVINQNFDPQWKASRGKIANYNGLISLIISDRISGPVSLRYFPSRFYIGFMISLSAFIFCCFLLLKKRIGYAETGLSGPRSEGN
jgi:hypothetical protein